ncbi:MAG: substrate import-associated zinc metallohydrolase lipoprotein [Flavobacteriaceae bacterium]
MKSKYFKFILVTLLTGTIASSCGNEEDSITESQIDISAPILNSLDIWLRENFVEQYNIEIRYKWNINDTDVDRFLHPPFEENVMPIANALTKVWIEPYNTLGGENFIKNIAPREFVISGGFNYNPGGQSITLGIAEAGARITLFNVDELDYELIDYGNNLRSIVSPISTIHHEYGHILNQNIPFDPVFNLVNPANYTSSWADRSNTQARELGYITAYAASQPSEDFVEMIAQMLVRSKSDFDELVDGIASAQARGYIREKEQLVVAYYEENFDIDFYELQVLTYQALVDLTN